jgi:hypothetical protein
VPNEAKTLPTKKLTHCYIGSVALRIKDPITPSISHRFYIWIGRGGPSTSYQSRDPEFIPPRPCMSATLIPPSLVRCPYGGTLLSTYMARPRGRSSHGVGEYCTKNKRLSCPSISPVFYSRIGWGVIQLGIRAEVLSLIPLSCIFLLS